MLSSQAPTTFGSVLIWPVAPRPVGAFADLKVGATSKSGHYVAFACIVLLDP
jgi:hypothetical protein